MCIFAKKTIIEKRVHVALDQEECTEDYDLIDLRAHTSIDGVRKTLFASLLLKDANMYKNGDYQKILKMFSNAEDLVLNAKLIFKNDKLTDFLFDIDDLAKTLNDPRLLQLEHAITYVMDDSEEEW